MPDLTAEHLCFAVLLAVLDGECEKRADSIFDNARNETVETALHKLAHVHVSLYPLADGPHAREEFWRRLAELEELEGPCLMASRKRAGQLLAEYRIKAGLSQSELAEQLCHTQATLTRNDVSRWERGQRLPQSWLPPVAAQLKLPKDVEEYVSAAGKRRPRALGGANDDP